MINKLNHNIKRGMSLSSFLQVFKLYPNLIECPDKAMGNVAKRFGITLEMMKRHIAEFEAECDL
jgi:hypothetical protein